MKRWIVMGAIAAVVVACGSDAASELVGDAGQIMRDAGEAMADAGAWLADAGTQGGRDAQAQTPTAIDARCDKVYERVVTNRSSQGAVTATVTTTRWYAELAMNTQGIIGVDVLKCDREVYGAQTEYCPEGSMCTGASTAPRTACQTSSFAEIAPGFIRIDCGYRQRVDYADPTSADSDSGELYKTVRFAVRR